MMADTLLATRVALKGVWLAAIGALVLALAIFGTVQSVRLGGLHLGPISYTGWIAKAGRFEAQRDAEAIAHKKTKDDYRQAQDEAAALERVRLREVQAAQQEISNAIESDYRGRLADARARAEQLRRQTQTRANAAGATDNESMPGVSPAAGGAAAASRGDGLPAAIGIANIERSLIATEQAFQLDALIDWVQAQAAIDPNRSTEELQPVD